MSETGGAAFPERVRSRGGALLLVSIRGLDAIRTSRGEEVAECLRRRLDDLLRSALRGEELSGALGSANGVLLPAEGGQARAEGLFAALAADFRFPLRAGLAVGGAPEDLAPRAEEALRAALEAEDDRLQLHSRGPLQPPPARPAAEPSGESGLAARYQKLVLINRFALGLLGERTLADSLAAVGHNVLALTGGRYLAVYHNENGELRTLHRQGEAAFLDDAALRAEASLIGGILRERAPAWLPREGLRLFGVPCAGPGTDSHLAGAIVVGFSRGAAPRTDEAAQALAEVSQLVYNALVMEDRLRLQRTLSALVDQSADPTLLQDLEGRITLWGRTAETLFGHPAELALRRDFSELLVPADRHPQRRQALAQVLEKGTLREQQTLLRCADGSMIPVEETLTRLDDERGRPFAVLVSLRDLRRRQELEQMKTEIVNVVSHDLRTPLTSIRGFAETLLEHWGKIPEEETLKLLRIVSRESDRLARLVSEFLDVSRLEMGASTLRREPLDLAALTGRVAETFGAPGAQEGEVVVELDFPAGLPKVSGDPDQVQRVLVNLVGNARKYSPVGGRIRVEGRRKEGEIEVSVSDEGPGVPPQARASIFQKFFRAGDAATAKLQGSGLGLYIVKTLVEAHGGRVGFDVPAKGSRFWFTLPTA